MLCSRCRSAWFCSLKCQKVRRAGSGRGGARRCAPGACAQAACLPLRSRTGRSTAPGAAATSSRMHWRRRSRSLRAGCASTTKSRCSRTMRWTAWSARRVLHARARRGVRNAAPRRAEACVSAAVRSVASRRVRWPPWRTCTAAQTPSPSRPAMTPTTCARCGRRKSALRWKHAPARLVRCAAPRRPALGAPDARGAQSGCGRRWWCRSCWGWTWTCTSGARTRHAALFIRALA